MLREAWGAASMSFITMFFPYTVELSFNITFIYHYSLSSMSGDLEKASGCFCSVLCGEQSEYKALNKRRINLQFSIYIYIYIYLYQRKVLTTY